MKILVTGGAGYIGSHTVVELSAAGLTPVIIDDFSNSQKSVINNLQKIIGCDIAFYEGKFQDTKLLNKILGEHKIDGIIHFAAFKAVSESMKQPLKYYDNNVSGLVRLLKVVQTHKIRFLVFSSSCTVYGEPDKLPITENSPIKPAASPYGATKQMGESVIRDTTLISNNLRSVALRYFNPIGAHPSALIGELPIGIPANLVPFVTQAAAGVRGELTVFGNDYPTPDGTNVRDYIHVVDLAKAHVKSLEHLLKQTAGFYDVFNIGTGKGSSVLGVIKTFQKVTGHKVPYKIGPRRPGDVIANYASTAKAKSVLEWEAEKSLEDALADAWRWQTILSKYKNT